MPTALSALTVDQRLRIVRTYLKGEASAATLQTEWDITESTFNDLVDLYDARTHPNDVGGTGLTTETLIPPVGNTGEARPE